MKSKPVDTLVFVLSVGILTFTPQPVDADSRFDVGGDVTLATDYVFRGVSQTMSAAAIQGSLYVEHESGLYGYLWASNVDYTAKGDPADGANVELDLEFGYDYKFSDRNNLTLSWVRYVFPDALPTIDYDYNEWIGTVAFDDSHRLSVGYSSDVFGSGSSGLHYAIASGLGLAGGHWLGIELGRYDLMNAYAESYNYGEVSLSGSLRLADWRLSIHAASDNAKKLYDEDVVRPRVVLSLTAEF